MSFDLILHAIAILSMRDLTVLLDKDTCLILETAFESSKILAHSTRHGFISFLAMLCGYLAFAICEETA